jgi:cell division protein FtsL
MEPNQEEKKSNNKILLLLLALLFVGNATFAYLWWQEKNRANTVVVEKQEVIVERDNVKADLLSLQQEYATLQTSDKSLQADLEAKKAEIAELIIQAEKHKDDAYIISKLRRETQTLRKIMQHYVVEIDSLNTLNKTVIAEKEKIAVDLNKEKVKTTQLSKDKDVLQSTVNMGSILKAENPTVKGVKFKSGGKKEVETTKASRVERLKVSFVLGENKIAKRGVKPVYVRLTSPDGKEICKSADEGNMVKFNGSKGYFAAKQDVNYKNEEVAVDVLCPSPTGFLPGKYLVDIICDDVIVGQTSIMLK